MAEQQFNPMARFERARSRAKQETTAETQAAKDAIARRFAALGMQGSGAAIKTDVQAQETGQKVLGQKLEGIQGAEEQELQRVGEVKEAREFAKGEREAGQKFGADQAAIQRKFASDEAKFGRAFAMEQMKEGQKFAQSEREAAQGFSSLMQDKQQFWQKNMAEKAQRLQESQFSRQFDQAVKQFELDEEVTRYNIKMSQSEANKKTIFQRIGDFGTSVWDGSIWG